MSDILDGTKVARTRVCAIERGRMQAGAQGYAFGSNAYDTHLLSEAMDTDEVMEWLSTMGEHDMSLPTETHIYDQDEHVDIAPGCWAISRAGLELINDLDVSNAIVLFKDYDPILHDWMNRDRDYF